MSPCFLLFIHAADSDYLLLQVDAHNIVPCWEASPKQEYGARTIRGKIHNVLNKYFTEFPPVIQHPHMAKQAALVILAAQVDKSDC